MPGERIIPTGYWGPMIDGARQWVRYTPDEERRVQERADEAARRAVGLKLLREAIVREALAHPLQEEMK